MDWEGSEKVNVNVLKDNFVCRMSFLHTARVLGRVAIFLIKHKDKFLARQT